MTKTMPEIESSGLSVVGLVREDNQDAILIPSPAAQASRDRSLFAVADGMGGYANGGMASSMALDRLWGSVADPSLRKPEQVLRHGIETANLDIYRAAQNLGAGRMGTTLTAAYIVGDRLYITHVGDSRAYLIRHGRITKLTADHTVVGDMVRARLISPEKVRTHAQRSILTKAVGLGLFIQPDFTQVRLQSQDCLVLCSDGVWSVIEDNEIAQICTAAETQHVSQSLVNLALERASDDNCSALTLRINGFTAAPDAPANPSTRPAGIGSWLRQAFKKP